MFRPNFSPSRLPPSLPFFSVRAETRRSNKSCNNRGSCPSYSLLLLLQADSLVAAMNRVNCSKHPRNCARDERVNSPRRAASCRPLERRKKYRRSFNLLTHTHAHAHALVSCHECKEEDSFLERYMYIGTSKLVEDIIGRSFVRIRWIDNLDNLDIRVYIYMI